METLNIHQKLAAIRVELQNRKIKKSGKNKQTGATYFELSDFLPHVNELCKDHNLNCFVSFNSETVSLVVYDGDSEKEIFCQVPYFNYDVPLSSKGSPMMQAIQYQGALITYYKRYVYMNMFGITDGEVIDGMPEAGKPLLSELKFEEAVKYISSGGDINTILKKYSISEDQLTILTRTSELNKKS